MDKTEIMGIWSYNTLHKMDLSTDKQLHFREGGSGSIVCSNEIILNFEWDISENKKI